MSIEQRPVRAMAKARLPKNVGVLIPAFNEAKTIEAVVREAATVARTVLVVDDGSTDGSAAIAELAGARVLRRDRNEGLGRALSEGILTLRELGMANVITLDGDAAHDAFSAVDLWAAHAKSGADLTIGSRFLTEKQLLAIPSHKVAANRFGANLVSRLLGVRLTDVACGMRVLGPRALSVPLESRGFGFTFELLWRAVRGELKLLEHPVPVRYDAREPFWTKQNEIIDFLRLCHAIAARRLAVAGLIECMLEGIGRFEQLVIRLEGQLYYLHGLEKYQAYLVQLQHPWFLPMADDKDFLMIDFDVIAADGFRADSA